MNPTMTRRLAAVVIVAGLLLACFFGLQDVDADGQECGSAIGGHSDGVPLDAVDACTDAVGDRLVLTLVILLGSLGLGGAVLFVAAGRERASA